MRQRVRATRGAMSRIRNLEIPRCAIALLRFARFTRAKRDAPPLFRRRDGGEFRCLALEQTAIESARANGKRGMGALLDDLAAVEHQDGGEAEHRWPTVGGSW